MRKHRLYDCWFEEGKEHTLGNIIYSCYLGEDGEEYSPSSNRFAVFSKEGTQINDYHIMSKDCDDWTKWEVIDTQLSPEDEWYKGHVLYIRVNKSNKDFPDNALCDDDRYCRKYI